MTFLVAVLVPFPVSTMIKYPSRNNLKEKELVLGEDFRGTASILTGRHDGRSRKLSGHIASTFTE